MAATLTPDIINDVLIASLAQICSKTILYELSGYAKARGYYSYNQTSYFMSDIKALID